MEAKHRDKSLERKTKVVKKEESLEEKIKKFEADWGVYTGIFNPLNSILYNENNKPKFLASFYAAFQGVELAIAFYPLIKSRKIRYRAQAFLSEDFYVEFTLLAIEVYQAELNKQYISLK